ncbi:hypothetical protein ACSBR1_003310 [Camellia fascicularis]
MNLDSYTSDGLHSSGGNSDGVSVFGHGRAEGEAEVAPNLEDAMVKLADVDKAQQKCHDDIGVRLDGQLDGHVITSGFIKRLSGPDKSWPEVHLEMRFSQAHLGELVLGGPIGSYSSQGIGSGLVGQNFSHTKTLAHEGSSKEIDKGSIKQLLKAASSARKKARQRNRSSKLSISSRRRGQSEAVARRNSQKEAMFRSASAALSRSLANRGNSRSRGDALILNEAQATLCMRKLLGVEFGQDEASIVNRIVQLEQQDKEKVGARIGSPGHASFAKDPFRVFSSWNSSLNFCKWQGVTCSHRHHQRASALNLSSLKLVGSLSPHIGNLTFLRVINLKNNSFHGVIPQEVGRLFRIRYLILGNNSFEGEFPVNVTHCSDLRVINLINNNLGGKVPTQLGSLPKLYELVLSPNHFFGTIPPTLGNIFALRFFNMSNNNLEGQTPVELGKLSNLEELQLSENKLTSMIPPAILNISSINILALVSNQLHGSLPSNLGLTLPKLERIYMGENQFSGTIPASLVNASRLGVIDLGSNSLTGGIPQNLGELKQLELLNFGLILLALQNPMTCSSSPP